MSIGAGLTNKYTIDYQIVSTESLNESSVEKHLHQ